jgi:hypothetical protein
MTWVGFEPTIPVFEGAKTVHALDRAATVTGNKYLLGFQKIREGFYYLSDSELLKTFLSWVVYICGLYNDAVSRSGCIALSDKINE